MCLTQRLNCTPQLMYRSGAWVFAAATDVDQLLAHGQEEQGTASLAAGQMAAAGQMTSRTAATRVPTTRRRRMHAVLTCLRLPS